MRDGLLELAHPVFSGGLVLYAGKQDSELVAMQPERDLTSACFTCRHARDFDQDLVAEAVAVGVVKRFEPVHAPDSHRHRSLLLWVRPGESFSMAKAWRRS